MTPADLVFLAARMLSALASLPLALLLQLLLLVIACRVLGIGSGSGLPRLRALFDRIEADPRALATYLGAVMLSAALIVSALVR
jgi:hypothetical protein